MDNASQHHSDGLRELIEARYVFPYNQKFIHAVDINSGMHLVYLPPYSPDYNPIEEGSSAMKAWIRRN